MSSDNHVAHGWTSAFAGTWEVAPLRRLLRGIDQGWSPAAEDRTTEPNEWAVLKLSAVSRGTFRPEEHKALPAELDPVRRLEVRRGDLLLTRANTPELVGDVCVVPEVRPNLMMSDLIYRLRLDTNRLDPRFTQYWLLSSPGRDQIARDARGSSQSMVKISQQTVRSWLIPVPSLDEQRAIADYLDEKTAAIDALIAKRERHIALLAEKRYAAISDLVAHGLGQVPLRCAGLPVPVQIPQHWMVQKLKHVVSFVTSGSRGWAEYYADEGPLFLRIGNLQRGSIDLDLGDLQHVSPPSGAEGARTRVCPGDVLVSITAFIGSVGWVPDHKIDAYVNQHIALVRPTPTKVHSKWLAYMLLADVGQAMLRLPVAGGAKEGLGLDDIRDIPVFVPPMVEQARIIEQIERMDAGCLRLRARIEGQIGKLREYRQTLISATVTGQLPVREEIPA